MDKNKSESSVLRNAYNGDLCLQIIEHIYFDAFQGIQFLVERRKSIETARKSRVIFEAVSALEKFWNPHQAPLAKANVIEPLILIEDESVDEKKSSKDLESEEEFELLGVENQGYYSNIGGTFDQGAEQDQIKRFGQY